MSNIVNYFTSLGKLYNNFNNHKDKLFVIEKNILWMFCLKKFKVT